MSWNTLGSILYHPLEIAPGVWVLSSEDHPDRDQAAMLFSKVIRREVKPEAIGPYGTLQLQVGRESTGFGGVPAFGFHHIHSVWVFQVQR